jgi:Reverse transcriptase (RNA-dependent DNA polymerase).
MFSWVLEIIKSTEMASRIFTENIQESMEKQLYVLGLFFDLTKMYDVINHEILLTKLEYYGIRGIIKAWLESCIISYQSEFVSIFKSDNRGRKEQLYKSSCKELKHRAPQGSVLGQLMHTQKIIKI